MLKLPSSFLSALHALALPLLASCAATTHLAVPAHLGTPSSLAALEAVIDQPGPLEVETLVAADWQVPLSGLLNLEDPAARGAELKDHDEPIQIFLHVLHHPTRGLFLIDSGVESAFVHDRSHTAVRGVVASVAGLDKLVVEVDTKSWLERQHEPVRGVFLTHLHLDHLMGLPDVARGTPLYAGPGEAEATSFQNLLVAPTTDQQLAGHVPLAEWQFGSGAELDGIAGVIDIFGDGSLWALWVPGHTPGSTAYVARSPSGPVLFTGDACHTVWGWQHAVEPGSFSSDQPRSRRSLLALLQLSQRHPRLDVRLGHQSLPTAAGATRRVTSAARD
jgi:N-acyl homoserine lactone hydrolase